MISRSIASSVGRSVASSLTPTTGGGAIPSIQHIILYGQSLSLGADPLFAGVHGVGNVISVANTTHKMFNIGVRVVADTTGVSNPNIQVTPASIASLTDLEEQGNPNASYPSYTIYGETMATGIAEWISKQSLLSCTGRSGYAVYSLGRQSTVLADNYHFQNTIATVIAAKELADAAGLVYSVPCIVWKHGEADSLANTPRATYKTRVLQLVDDYREYIAANGMVDTSDLYFLTDQQGYQQTGFSYGSIAVAMAEMHRESGGKVIVIGPAYDQDFTSIADAHLTALGYRLRGEMYGKVQSRIAAGQSWSPTIITAASRSGTTITLTVHVPVPPLVIDTSYVSSVANSGFTYSGATITGVSITDTGVGDNTGTIEITLNTAAGGTLGVGYENGTNQRTGRVHGPRTNFRDSDSAVSIHNGSALHNYLCTDQWSIA